LAQPRISSARRPPRFLAAAGAVSVLALGLAACGGSSPGSTSTTSQQSSARRGVFSDPKVQACLKQQGVEVPNLRRRSGQGSNEQPPSGGSGQPPNGGNGQPRSGQGPPNGGFSNSARGQELRAALQKCGVTLPNRGQNGPPQRQQDATPSDTTAS
jgi:hypothetical protein